MKKERFSFLILFVEIAAIVLLHTAKKEHSESNAVYGVKKTTAVTTPYQLKALSLTKVK